MVSAPFQANTRESIRLVQTGLKGLGHDPGPLDGIWGKRTEGAMRAMLATAGKPVLADAVTDLPWMAEGKRFLGRHEIRDNSLLRKWLKSDGKTLGDPMKLPWCGDFVETCIRLALPGESFPGALGQNPYWARNWLRLGAEIAPCYGAVVVFERGSGGHVGFAVGEDATTLHVLGGNQSNAVTIARIAKSRLLGARWPATFPRPLSIRLPQMTAGGAVSTNEA
ncbi:TIGR02594 family protein [Pseudotabrizicola alkalilacus]|uniref:TIGR02594 family protein n=2 Tax=Pseudotabrizicola alkalilacus TaxID=2305252 RepID=A0A411Z4K6_9RHOB|nr:TIGR02594 family protein [Pseudotabrizicola alkalilacus]RGP38007.1 TIGR02594 family protein [Pseudotabrizicola alkalilacus]